MARKKKAEFLRFIVIPDTQCKPGVPLDHLTWAGKYIAEHRPDVIVHLGDHWDMESLSSYDQGKHCFEGRRVMKDIRAGNRGMKMLEAPFVKIRNYSPELYFLFGNHEDRLTRLLESEPKFRGLVGFEDFKLGRWSKHDFLKPLVLDGITFSHYLYNPRNGRPYTGTALSILKNVGTSFVMGHRQGLETCIQQLPTGSRRRGVVAGSFYQHDEQYLGPQGQHWRGILVLNEVQSGDFDLCEVSLEYLRRKYSKAR